MNLYESMTIILGASAEIKYYIRLFFFQYIIENASAFSFLFIIPVVMLDPDVFVIATVIGMSRELSIKEGGGVCNFTFG